MSVNPLRRKARPALRAYPMPGSPIGWAGRCRTCYLGVKVPCLTVWPQPNKKAPHGTHQREARGGAYRELQLASKLDFYRIIGFGAARRIRTLGLLLTRQPLYQLSYDGIMGRCRPSYFACRVARVYLPATRHGEQNLQLCYGYQPHKAHKKQATMPPARAWCRCVHHRRCTEHTAAGRSLFDGRSANESHKERFPPAGTSHATG